MSGYLDKGLDCFYWEKCPHIWGCYNDFGI